MVMGGEGFFYCYIFCSLSPSFCVPILLVTVLYIPKEEYARKHFRSTEIRTRLDLVLFHISVAAQDC